MKISHQTFCWMLFTILLLNIWKYTDGLANLFAALSAFGLIGWFWRKE